MKCLLLWISLLLPAIESYAQTDSLSEQSERLSFFEPAPSFHKARVWGMTSGIAVSYTAVTIGLNQAWYADYPRSSFHTFNDWNGWRQMDKFGHAMTGYFESKWVGDLYQWAGVPQKEARWIGFGAGMLFQTTLEVMDGFSAQWGFSWGDMGFNLLGSGTYLAQELLWKEQRIRWKMSAHRPRYSNAPFEATNSNATTTLQQRAARLYGTSPAELLFKEYNGQTIWLSANVASFLPKTTAKTPFQWVNVAVGYGIENVYGAERNGWEDDQGNIFVVPTHHQRQSQFFLSLDIDFERIPTRHKWLKTIFGILNIFKIPFPALEVNTTGGVHFHPFYF